MTGIEEAAGALAAETAASTTAASVVTGTAAAGAAAAGTAAAGTAAAASGGLLTTLAGISPYLTGASTALSALGSIAGGRQQANALQTNATIAQENAGTAAFTSEAEAQRQQIASSRRVASAANSFGASGVDFSSGSPLDVLADQAGQGALDSEITRWKGQTQQASYLNQAAQDSYQAGQVATAGDITAGSTVLTAGAKYATGLLPKQYVPGGGSV